MQSVYIDTNIRRTQAMPMLRVTGITSMILVCCNCHTPFDIKEDDAGQQVPRCPECEHVACSDCTFDMPKFTAQPFEKVASHAKQIQKKITHTK